jgi:hypothetical protein
MSYDDSEALLFKTAYGDTAPDDRFKKKGLNAAGTLGRLALAIVQAGAYIRETLCPLEEYLERYQRRQKEMRGYFPRYSGADYYYIVYTTWQVSSVRSQRYRFQGTSQPIRTKPDFLGTTNVPNESLCTVVMVGTLP